MYGDLNKKGYSYEVVEPTNFGTLQIPILIKIFSHLENDYLLKCVSLVCKHWRFAVMQPPFIKSLSIHSMNDIKLSYSFSFIRRFYDLQALYLEGIIKPSAILFQASKCIKRLIKLSLINCQNAERGLLKFIVKKFPELESLNLEGTNFNDMPVYTIIKSLKNLRSLNLSKIKNLQTHIILATVINCRNLEELHLASLAPGVNLTDDDACLVIVNMGEKLKSLTIDARSLLTTRTFEALVNKCRNLQFLHISYSVNLSSEFLIDFLHRLPPLKHLGFTHNSGITDQELARIFDAENVENIRNLDFTRCIMLGDLTIESIVKNCRGLEKIVLKSCKNIKNINPLMKMCKSLKYLNIAFCEKLELPFVIPRRLEEIILHEDEKFKDVLIKLKNRKCIRVFLSLAEYTESLRRL